MKVARLYLASSILFSLLCVAAQATAQTETVLFSFPAGSLPYAGLVRDTSSNLYGTNVEGGEFRFGQVFELSPATGGTWTKKVLHSFRATDGEHPYAALTLDASGNLYGISEGGGRFGGGTAFELTPDGQGNWNGKLLHIFGDPDASNTISRLLLDAQGNLYGVGQNGGSSMDGAVFEIAAGTWAETLLDSLRFDIEGHGPQTGLVMDAQGNLYGTTDSGGESNCGTVFQLSQVSGHWVENTLHDFACGSDGGVPSGDMVLDAHGNLFFATKAGGTANFGAVFELSPAAGGIWNETILYSFQGDADGNAPVGGLTADSQGNLFGTTQFGGGQGKCKDIFTQKNVFCGTVFKLAAASGGWNETVLYSFTGHHGDGAQPTGSVVLDDQGNIFGTTAFGGFFGSGTVFELAP